jgi:hypothetical protein
VAWTDRLRSPRDATAEIGGQCGSPPERTRRAAEPKRSTFKQKALQVIASCRKPSPVGCRKERKGMASNEARMGGTKQAVRC